MKKENVEKEWIPDLDVPIADKYEAVQASEVNR